ncbi:MAG: T9SS type A sorting domain-containing protein [Bacteroidales bacterium]|nr:T9SS type A sorting domain-containing protein [Bacteroidales bacterium]
MRKIFTILLFSGLCFCLLNTTAQPITVQGHSSADEGSTINIPKPAGLQKNDIMLAHISGRLSGSVSGLIPPSGWTKIKSIIDAGSVGSHIFYKVATASEPTSYSFSDSGSTSLTDKVGVISVYRGVDTLIPINASGGAAYSSGFITPSIITTADSCMIVTLFGQRQGSSYTPPSGMTENYDTTAGSSSNETICGDYVIQPLAGVTGQKTATGGGNYGTAGIVALKPASHAVGIKNINEQSLSFRIYPNPVSLFLNLTFNITGEAYFIVTNILGQEMINITLNSYKNNASVNVSELPAGMYFCRIQTANSKSEIRKFNVFK